MASFTKVKANNKQGYKWICVKDGPPDPATGNRKQIARRGDTKKEAEERVDAAIKKLKETKHDEKLIKSLKFEKVASDWLKTYSRGKRKKSTIRIREKEIKILNRYIAKAGIAEITPRKHQEILNDLFDKGYAKSTIEGVHVTAGMIYKYAIKEKYRDDNPCVGAEIPEREVTVDDIENASIENDYLTRGELSEFLDTVLKHGKDEDKEIFFLLAFTGMRPGELCALWESVLNFKENKIKIIRTMYNPDNNMRKYELTPPKTKGSIREIVVEPEIMDMLKAHVRSMTKLKMKARLVEEDICEDNFVFCRPNGYPYIQKTLINRMNRLLNKTTITKEATPHIFRHTHVSMLAEAGVDLPTIMKRVGHDDMDTTLKIYLHVTEKMQQNASLKVQTTYNDLLHMIEAK
ncbi:site-specific integrase [Xylanibacillus composti]|uniref:Site-specific integrase n=1 Tax=Xylanibacillus composti TaxID=1572762 RepID=A0A8J4M016_9BACL|nr:site-specific integrase [Xylanibacillus composti]MDT9723827.1 site-specific integrase [Xylanibacillus composti]GIQ67395.1 site-specific integrase [Xylanibacillus composti]